MDPTNPYNQAWQSKQHYSYATQGNFPIQGGYGETAPHMFSPHYHMPVPPIRFGQSTPYGSSSGFYPRQRDRASDVNIQQSYFNDPNYAPQHQSEPEFSFMVNTPIKHKRKAHAVGGAVRHSPSSNPLTPPAQQSSSGPDIYVKEGRRYFAKTPKPSDVPSSVPTPPMTPVSPESSLSGIYSQSDYQDHMSILSHTQVKLFAFINILKQKYSLLIPKFLVC